MTPRTVLTPQQLADRWQCSHDAVLTLIRNAELRAFNVAARAGIGHKARWRISLSEIETFEQRRAARPEVKVERRRRAAGEVIQFYK